MKPGEPLHTGGVAIISSIAAHSVELLRSVVRITAELLKICAAATHIEHEISHETPDPLAKSNKRR